MDNQFLQIVIKSVKSQQQIYELTIFKAICFLNLNSQLPIYNIFTVNKQSRTFMSYKERAEQDHLKFNTHQDHYVSRFQKNQTQHFVHANLSNANLLERNNQRIPGYQRFTSRNERAELRGSGGQYYNRSRSRSPNRYTPNKEPGRNTSSTLNNTNISRNLINRNTNLYTPQKVTQRNNYNVNQGNLIPISASKKHDSQTITFNQNPCNFNQQTVNSSKQMPFLNNSYESQNNSFKSISQPTFKRINASNLVQQANFNYGNQNYNFLNQNSIPICQESQGIFTQPKVNLQNNGFSQSNEQPFSQNYQSLNNQFFQNNSQSHQNNNQLYQNNSQLLQNNGQLHQNNSQLHQNINQLHQNNAQQSFFSPQIFCPQSNDYNFNPNNINANNFYSNNNFQNNSNFDNNYNGFINNYYIQNPQNQNTPYIQNNNGLKKSLFSLPQPEELFNYNGNSYNFYNESFQRYQQITVRTMNLINELSKSKKEIGSQQGRNIEQKYLQYWQNDRIDSYNRIDRYRPQRSDSPIQVIQFIIKSRSKSKKKLKTGKQNKKPLQSNKKKVFKKQTKNNQFQEHAQSNCRFRVQTTIKRNNNQKIKQQQQLLSPIKQEDFQQQFITRPFEISWKEKPITVYYQLQFVNNDYGVIQFDLVINHKDNNKWIKQRQKLFQSLFKQNGIPLIIKGQQKFQAYPENQQMKRQIRSSIQHKYPIISDTHLFNQNQNKNHQKTSSTSVSTAVSYSSICESMHLQSMVVSLRTEFCKIQGRLQNVKLKYVYPLVLLFQNDPDTNQSNYKYSYSYYDGNRVWELKIWNQYGEVKFKQVLQIGPNPQRRKLNLNKKFAIGKFQIECYEKWLDSPCQCKFYGLPDAVLKYVKNGKKQQARKTLCQYQAKPFKLKQISQSEPHFFVVQIDTFNVQEYKLEEERSYLKSAKNLMINSAKKAIILGEGLIDMFVFAISPWKW